MRRGELTRKFFEKDTLTVARELLGKTIVSELGNKKKLGRIVETEAYVGTVDMASHARFGETARSKMMYGQAGHAYIYLIYGMYDLLNFVTEQKGEPGAVLIRAIEPLAGENINPRIASGPGKLTRWLGVTRLVNGVDLVNGKKLYVLDGPKIPEKNIIKTTRIGVEYAGEWAKKPWRFYIANNPAVSKK